MAWKDGSGRDYIGFFIIMGFLAMGFFIIMPFFMGFFIIGFFIIIGFFAIGAAGGGGVWAKTGTTNEATRAVAAILAINFME